MSDHSVDVCACGAVLASCRCPGPHPKRVVSQSCRACRDQQYGAAAWSFGEALRDLGRRIEEARHER